LKKIKKNLGGRGERVSRIGMNMIEGMQHGILAYIYIYMLGGSLSY